MAEKLELEDFSGGITDYYLSAPPNKMRDCDNLLINQYQNQGKVFTRPGSVLYDKTADRPDANRATTCFYYKDKLYVQIAGNLFYYKSTTVMATALVAGEVYQITNLGSTNFVLVGAKTNEVGVYFTASGPGLGTGNVRKGIWEFVDVPDDNFAFPGTTPSHQFTYDNWNYHTLIANSSLPGYPMKVLQNGDSISLVQAGLPKLDSDGIYFQISATQITAGSFIVGQKYRIAFVGSTNFTLIGAPNNSIGTDFTATGAGSGTGTANRIWNLSYLYKFVYKKQYTAGPYSTNILSVENLQKNKIYKIESIGTTNFKLAGAPANIVGLYFIATNATFGTGTVTTTDSDFFTDLGSPSLPATANNPVMDPITTSTPNQVFLSYIAGEKEVYAGNFVINKKYRIKNVGTTNFTSIGASSNTVGVEFFATGAGTGDGSATELLNTTETNFNEDELQIDVYRTTNNGTNYYYVGTAAFGDISFYDDVSDENLTLREPLYTNGGVVANDLPPKCRSIHIRNDIAYYGGILGQSYRLLQAVPGDIDSVPETFYVDVDDEIVAVSSTKNNVIILCKEKVYRVDGIFDELGRGGMVVERISDTAGCVGVNTPVQALDGVMWLGKEAVYFTDGFKVIKLNQDYDKTYKSFTDSDLRNVKYQGKYDNKKNRVWWTVQDEDASDLNKCYVLDLNWGIRENSTFTTVTGYSFAPSAIEFINGNMVRCDVNGYVLYHQDTLFTDPKIGSAASVLDWRDEVIVYNLETSSYNFGTSAVRKYVTQANVTCESTTNLSLRIVSNNDDDRIVADLLPIRYRGNIVWGEPDIYWGDITLEWNRQGLIHEKRLMPAKNLRCNYKALKFTNAHVAILSSDTTASAIINPSLKTATLLTNSIIVNAGNFIVNVNYTITEIGTTDFTLIGASSNTVGLVFTATGSGSGTGKAKQIFEYEWPDKSIGYFISFAEDGYVKEYEIVNKGTDVIIFSDVLNAVGSGTQKWVIRGRPLGEVLNLLNVSVIYDVAGPSQTAFKVSTSGEVQ
jgi:hypothetical protein